MIEMRQKIAVAIPDSTVADIFETREKTVQLGMIARALAIFQVSEVIIYRSDLPANKSQFEARFISNVLSYIETPQYLRKDLFPFHKDLKFAGMLPPLATPHHQTDKKLKHKQYREGVLFLRQGGVHADVGANQTVEVRNPPATSLKGRRVRATLQIFKENTDVYAEVVKREKVEEKDYWGYQIRISNQTFPKFDRKREYTIITTSKKGTPYHEMELPPQQKPLLFVFGTPKKGLYDLLKGTNVKMSDIADRVVNSIPNAGTRSVRLEEAIPITLARLLPLFGMN